MMKDAGAVGLESLRVVFDDERVVSDAGVALVATLAGRLAIEGLVSRFVRLRRDRPGAANAGRKVMALVYAMLLGADSIDDCELLRAGRTRRLLGGWLPAPSTLGTFLRAFTFGHVRQLDRVLAEALTRAWRAGAGPGAERLVVDVDSFVGEVHGYHKQGAGFGYTKRRGYHPLLASRADSGEVLHVRLRKGKANSARGVVRFACELIARVARAGANGVKLLILMSFRTRPLGRSRSIRYVEPTTLSRSWVLQTAVTAEFQCRKLSGSATKSNTSPIGRRMRTLVSNLVTRRPLLVQPLRAAAQRGEWRSRGRGLAGIPSVSPPHTRGCARG
jgi:Transposase DDE domain group 1